MLVNITGGEGEASKSPVEQMINFQPLRNVIKLIFRPASRSIDVRCLVFCSSTSTTTSFADNATGDKNTSVRGDGTTK